MERHINVPIDKETAKKLRAGDYVYLTGTIYTARDAAHKRMYEALEKGEALPLEMKDNVIYYMGPSPARGGGRSEAVEEAIARNGAVYFAAVGGAGALLAGSIKASEVIAYDDLGTEAIRKLEVENFPVIVVTDSAGQDLYETAIREYCKL